MIRLSKELSRRSARSAAEVAVIVSGKSMYCVNKCSGVNDTLLRLQREGLMRLGAPFDYYSLEDIAHIDIDKYKLFVFANAFSLSDEERKAVEKIKNAGGKTLLWSYAPAYEDGGIDSASAITEIKLGEYSTVPTINEECGTMLPSPYFFAEEGEALVKFSDGRSAVARRECDTFTSVYSAIGNLDAETLRRIAKDAGVHIFCETAPVYVNETVIGVYNTEECKVDLLRDGVLLDLFSGEKYVSDNCTVTLPKTDCASKLLIYADPHA